MLLFNFVGCGAPQGNKEKEQEQEKTVIEEASLPEDFVEFYVQFHKDSIFQLDHILFPMQGEPIAKENYTAEELKNFRWTKENWEFHKKNPTLNENFTTNFQMLGNTMITEYVNHNTGMFGMERRFSKSGDTWNLIYYKGMNSTGDWVPKK